jgi:hypothetical protein
MHSSQRNYAYSAFHSHVSAAQHGYCMDMPEIVKSTLYFRHVSLYRNTSADSSNLDTVVRSKISFRHRLLHYNQLLSSRTINADHAYLIDEAQHGTFPHCSCVLAPVDIGRQPMN